MSVVKFSPVRLGNIVDKLGHIKAQIANLEAQATELKDILVDAGEDSVDGKLFRATVSYSSRTYLDQALVKSFLTLDQIKAATKETPQVTVRVVSR